MQTVVLAPGAPDHYHIVAAYKYLLYDAVQTVMRLETGILCSLWTA